MIVRSSRLQYLLAITSSVVGCGIQVAIGDAVGFDYVFQALYIAVLFSAWIGGFGPAIAALATGSMLSALFLLEPRGSWAILESDDQVGWILFILTGLCIALMGAKMRRNQTAAEDASNRLREQAEWLRTTLGSIGDAVIVTDTGGNVQLMNEMAQKLTGWPQEEAVGQPLSQVFRIINQRTRVPLESPAERALREGSIVGLANNTLLIDRKGNEFPIDDSAAPIRNEGGPIVGVVLVFRDITSRRRAERRLRANEERLKAALEAGRMGTWEWNINTNEVTWSAELERLHKLKPGTFRGTFDAFQSDIHPDDRERVLARIQETLKTGQDYHVEYRLQLPDATTRWVESRGKITRDERGAPRRMFGVCMDITRRKETEEQIHLHSNVLESMIEGVMLCDRTGMIWYTNPAADRMFGYRPGELYGQYVTHLNDYPPEENERIVGELLEHLEIHGTWQGEFRNRRKDGSLFTTAARINALEIGGQKHWLSVQEDITEQKRREEDLEFLAEASRTLSTTLDYKQTLQRIARVAVPHFADWCLVHLADPSGVPQQLVAAHIDPKKVAIAEEYYRRFPPNPDETTGIIQAIRTGESRFVEELTPDILKATTHHEEQLRILQELDLISYMVVPLKLPDRVIGTLSFITAESHRVFSRRDLVVAEDLARRAAKAIENSRLYARLREEHRRKDEFLAMLAHELRNPLAPIRSGLELLSLSGIEHETIPVMREQTAHLARLVDDLLDVSRIVQGKIRLQQKPVELGEIIKHTVEATKPLADEQRHHIEVSLPETPVWVLGDRVRLSQCLTNLLHNAIKYTEPAGRIWVSLATEGGQAELAVEDDGIGIEPEMLPHLFDLFTQADRSLERSKGGLGIGLTLVRNLVEAHGGSVTAHSAGLGEGSEFLITLPTCEPPPQADESLETEDLSQQRRVLVVDDNVGAARVLGLLLNTAGGHEVEYAYDGASALQTAREFQPEVILLDIGLPEMSGYDIVREFRADDRHQNSLIVALTGYGTEEDRLRSLEAGFDDHLVKPPSLDMLTELFRHPKLKRMADAPVG
jgi:PAS domain S-box-containing protein